MAEVVWSPQAISDVEAIKAYIGRDPVHYAQLVVDRLIAAAERAGSFPESGRIVPEVAEAQLVGQIGAVMLALMLVIGATALGASGTGELVLPAGLAPWLEVWSAPGMPLHAADFQRGSTRRLSELYVYPDSLQNAELIASGSFPRAWVVSPDSNLAVCVPPPGDGPDSQIDVVDLSSGRRAAILITGTLADFEYPCWASETVILVGGGNWEDVAPLLIRVDMEERTLEWFEGPLRPADQESALYEAVRGLWEQTFAEER